MKRRAVRSRPRTTATQIRRASEQRLRFLLTKGPAVLYACAPCGNYGATYISDAVSKHLGYAPGEFLASESFWADHVHPEDRDRIFAELPRLLETDRHSHEYRFRHKDGSWRWMHDELTLVRDAAGLPIEIVGSWLDVTERVQAQRALAASEKRLRDVIDAVFGFVGLFALDGVLIDLNRAPLEAAGLRKEEVLGKPFADTYWWSHSATERERLRAALCRAAAGEAVRYESQAQMAGGRIVVVDATFAPLRDTHGRIVNVVGFGMDITERRRAEDAVLVVAREMDAARRAALNMMEDAVEARAGLEAANAALVKEVAERERVEDALHQLSAELEQRVLERTTQLDAANMELEAFSYSVSHDLRAPLRHTVGFSNILREDYSEKLDDQGRHYLDRIQAGCARMGQLINDLLALSRVSCQPLRRERVDLSALARSVAAELQAAKPERTADLVFADGIIAQGDVALLRVVMENLFGNAWKYSAKRPHARIEFGIGAGESGGAVETSSAPLPPSSPAIFFVRDNGAGFDPAFSDKLFAPFQRLHSATEFEGTGIGLAIVARIIRRHAGQVWAEGAVEQGATFYFTLGDSALASSERPADGASPSGTGPERPQ